MKRDIKFSFLVPVYNVPEKLLKGCLNSLIHQTYKNFEVIIVDDGSTTDSSFICDDFAHDNKNVVCIHKENGGLSSARNAAFCKASGDYVMFVDGDDYLDNNCLEEMFQILQSNYYDVIMFDVKSICGNTVLINHSFKYKKKTWDANDSFFLKKRVLDFNGKIAQVFAKCFRREFLKSNNLLHNEYCKQGAEGILFNFEVFSAHPSVIYINNPFYNYVYNFESISHKLSKENVENTLKCFEEIYLKITANKDNKLLIDFYSRMQYVIVTACISGFANPDNKNKLKDIKNMLKWLNNISIVKNTYEFKNLYKMSFIRRFTLFCIKHKLVLAIKLIAFIRYTTVRKGII